MLRVWEGLELARRVTDAEPAIDTSHLHYGDWSLAPYARAGPGLEQSRQRLGQWIRYLKITTRAAAWTLQSMRQKSRRVYRQEVDPFLDKPRVNKCHAIWDAL